MTHTFALAFDYLCPFARNASEHIVTGLRAGADWDVEFVPYSLAQGHVDEDGTAVWDRETPIRSSGILALQAGLVVRDTHPESFLDAHEALFAVKHDRGLDLKDPEALADALDGVGLHGTEVIERAAAPALTAQLRREHEAGVRDHGVWGVPTFIGARRAVFVRILDRPEGDAERARARIGQVIDLVDSEPMLHEFKQVNLAA